MHRWEGLNKIVLQNVYVLCVFWTRVSVTWNGNYGHSGRCQVQKCPFCSLCRASVRQLHAEPQLSSTPLWVFVRPASPGMSWRKGIWASLWFHSLKDCAQVGDGKEAQSAGPRHLVPFYDWYMAEQRPHTLNCPPAWELLAAYYKRSDPSSCPSSI